MPTPKLKIIIDGKEVAPINKHKLPLSVDWQSLAAKKKAEAAKKVTEE